MLQHFLFSPALISRCLAAASLMLAMMVALSGCRTEGEVFIVETSLVGNPQEGYGPYEVDIRLNGTRPVDRVQLFWQLDGQGEVFDTDASDNGGVEQSYRAQIKPTFRIGDDGLVELIPFALGTRVSYWVTATSADGSVTSAPIEAPAETYAFTVGPANLPISVAEVSPDNGPSVGGTPVFIRGENFREGVEVIFNGSLARQVRVVTPHLLEVITPAAPAGLAEVIVRSPTGPVGRLPDAFFFIAPPAPALVEPDRGPTSGGTRVTITGTGFVQDSEVVFGDEPATEVEFIDPQTLFATTPANPEGPVTVTVTNPDEQEGSLEAGFTYVAPPDIEGIDPEVGPVEGDTRVELTGTGFQLGLRLFFDGLEATVIDVSETLIVARTPAHPAGRVDVTVVNPDNQRDVAPEFFTYLGPPSLVDVDPDQGPTLGGTEITLRGRNFFEGMSVTLDGLACRNVVVESDTLARCITPPHPEGFVDVTVRNIDNQGATLTNGFEYIPPPPEIIGLDPDRGPDLGGTTVVIEVRFAQDGIEVFFDGRAAEVVSIERDGDVARVTVITPPHPEGPVDVRVQNPDNLEDTLPEGFLYVGPPIIDDIDPSEGPDTGGQEVTITGRNFLLGMTVTFDGLDAEVIDIDPVAGTITVITPPHPEGFVDVTVTTPEGRSDTAPAGYEYILLPPTITSVDPDRGPVWGGNEIVIEGSSFREGLQVLIAGIPATVQRVNGGTLRVTAPPGIEGDATIEVINPDGQADTASYTYVSPQAAPDKGLIAGFTTVTISGEGFDEGTTVTFNGVPAVEVFFVSPQRIEAVTPAGTLGAATLGINTGNGGGVFDDLYAYTIFTDATDGTGLAAERNCVETEVADVDGDGDDDIAVANGGFFQSSIDEVPNAVYINNGGTFIRRMLIPQENSMNADFADIEGDGDLDLFISNLTGDGAGERSRLYLNDGAGNFTDVTDRLPINRVSYDAGFIDANADGNPDVMLINTADPKNLFINNGAGVFTDRSGLLPAGDSTEHDHDFHFGDLNGDQFPDVVIGVDNTRENNRQRRYDADNRIFMSRPDGSYELKLDTDFTEVEGDFLEVQVADVNGDGLDDIITVDNIDRSAPNTNPVTGRVRNGVLIFINQGNGDFDLEPQRVPQDLIGPGVSVIVADIDSDGDVDIAAAVATNFGDLDPNGARGQPNWLLVNRGDGFFFDASAAWPANRDATWDFSTMDANGDGVTDLYECNYFAPNRMLIQTDTP